MNIDPRRSAAEHITDAGGMTLTWPARGLLPPGRFVELAGGHCLRRDQPARWLTSVAAFAGATSR
jgi:hypothetical protein